MLLVRSLGRILTQSGTAGLCKASPNIQKWTTYSPRLSFTSNLKISQRYQSNSSEQKITVYFIDRDGEKIAAKAKLGTSLLDVAIDNNIDLEGACEGTLSCSTCHLILRKEDYEKLKPPSDEENDMLDLAFGLTDTSRLGCQITVDEKMDGWTFVVPKEVSDARK